MGLVIRSVLPMVLIFVLVDVSPLSSSLLWSAKTIDVTNAAAAAATATVTADEAEAEVASAARDWANDVGSAILVTLVDK